jgi:hypothetical protein
MFCAVSCEQCFASENWIVGLRFASDDLIVGAYFASDDLGWPGARQAADPLPGGHHLSQHHGSGSFPRRRPSCQRR